jgi:abortive infection bacteriophage resistance protein
MLKCQGFFFFMGEMLMRYTKPPRTFEEQAELIISRGLLVDDKNKLVNILSFVNYYRLSAYWYPFKQPDESLLPGISLDKIWRRYTFDRQLRFLVMDAIERVEIAVKTSMINMFSLEHGAFGYLDIKNFSPRYTFQNHQRLLDEIKNNTDRSREEFVKHYKSKYGEEKDLPLWMVSEVMTFGNMFSMFTGIDRNMRIQVARNYNVSASVLESWLKNLNYIRNLCAHHARLWNRELAIKPSIPNKNPQWHTFVEIENHRIFSVLTMLRYMLSFVAPHSNWQSRLESLLAEYSEIPLIPMGFPENWKESLIWKGDVK